MGRGWKLYEQVKDALDSNVVLEEVARVLTDDQLLDVMKTVVKNFDIDL